MIANPIPYPKMKDSGVPWLGEVPEHWDVLPNRVLFGEVKERDHPEEPMLSVTITKGVIRQRALLANSSKKDSSNQDKSAYKLVRLGDIAYNKMRAWQGAIGVSDYQGIVSPAYVVERPRKGTSSRYLHYLLRTPAFAKEAERWSYGITSDMWSLRPEHFKMIYGCLPPLHEQAAIVRFLDHADRRIRRYIRAKQKLIKLLEEQKQAFIHQAVTGQINVRTGKPYQAYKSSGVEWFPEVPDHWNVLPMRRVIYSAVDGPHFSPTYLDTGIPFLSARNVKSDAWSLEDAKYISEEDYDEFNRRVKPVRGDVLYTKGGTTGVARVVDLTFPFQVWVHIAVLKVNKNAIDPGFLAAALNSTRCYEQSQLFTRGATNQDLGLGRMKGIELPVPPALAEQQTIVGYLRTGLGQVLEAISATHREIGLLREYRTRLIADVVTGKLDVREAAASLLEEADERDPPDEVVLLADDVVDNLYHRVGRGAGNGK